MVSYLNPVRSPLHKLVPEKEKKNVCCQEKNYGNKAKDAEQCQTDRQTKFVDMAAEDKELLDMLYKLEKQKENPPFVIDMEESKQKKKELNDFYLATKKSNLKMLVRSAQMRSPQQYTGKSWQYLRQQMREAMRLAGNANASTVSLNRAMNHMRTGLLGLRFKTQKPEYKNLKKPLPNERIAQKPKTLQEKLQRKHHIAYEVYKQKNSVYGHEEQYSQANCRGGNLDVNCSEASVSADCAPAENFDVEA